MAIPAQRVKQSAILSSGTLTTLAIAFTFQDHDFIKIFVNDIQISAFSIAGSTITFSPPLTAPSNITVYYDVPLSDTSDFSESQQWSSSAVNGRFNLLALEIQKIYEKIGLIFPDSEETNSSNALLPIDRANRILTFDNDKNISLKTDDELVGGIISEVEYFAESAAGSAANAASSATSAATSASNASSSATSAASSATSATASATSASTSATSATASANSASSSSTSAGASASAASSSAILAQAWAESATEVTPGHESAKTWANTASAIAIPVGSITSDKLNYDAAYLNSGNATGVTPQLANYTIPYSGFYEVSINLIYNSGTGPIDVGILYDATPDTFPLISNISPSANVVRSSNLPFILLPAGAVVTANISGGATVNVDYRISIIRVK